MVKKELILCCAIIVVGLLDWLTTVIAITFFGAIEVNPLLAGFTQTNMIIFSLIKLSAVSLTGIAFYKAGTIEKIKTQITPLTKGFMNVGFCITLLILTTAVMNNIIATASSI